jgi:hypothetical protein
MAVDAIQHLRQARPLRQPSQLTREVLLQRLAAQLSSALKSRVDVLRDVSHEHVRHAYIMLSLAASPQPEAATDQRYEPALTIP